MSGRAIALTAVLVTAAIVPPPEAEAAGDPQPPPAPDLDQALATLDLPSLPTQSVPEPLAVPAVAPVSAPPVAPPPAPTRAAPTTSSTATGRRGAGAAGKKRPGDPLARIRACESGGNYSARSASGRYRGAYQFDHATFASVGGSGDPAAASPAEQDHRARLLLARRGTQAWPACSGRS